MKKIKIGKTRKRRRNEYKTNYSKRLNLLKGGFPRIVFRKSNRYITVQLVKSVNAQDKVDFGLTSKKLLEYGWPKDVNNSLKNIPAVYLTGYLFGKKIHEKKIGKVSFDMGLIRNVHKSKVYALIKGLKDAGISITNKEKIFPEEKRIMGEHLKDENIIKKLKEIKTKIGGEK